MNVVTNPTGSSQMFKNREKHDKQLIYSDSLEAINIKSKTYQNEQILVDDNGVRMKGLTVYKDLVIYSFLRFLDGFLRFTASLLLWG